MTHTPRHPVVNLYQRADGTTYWGKPHRTRKAAENADRWCGWDGKRVIARCVVKNQHERTQDMTKILDQKKTSVVTDAMDDIRENLWILGDKARTRVFGWFMAINKEAYERGEATTKSQPLSALSKEDLQLVLEGLRLRRQQIMAYNPGIPVEAVDRCADIEQQIIWVLSGVPMTT
jgi:hypothetical protein